GGHFNGCRIGFDAGGSDRKVSAVIDGDCVYSEEVVWHPKEQTDPQYHFDGIIMAMQAAASHMPRVDGIGVSSAGVCIGNRLMVSSLFTKVPAPLFDRMGKDIYLQAGQRFGDIPITVCNDGDVTALSGAISSGQTSVLGIAMGTSEAAGYVDRSGNITGWLNELAFVPVDASPDAMRDEWSGDIGCGVKYFSQDSIIKLALAAGIPLDMNATPAEKLKAVQSRMEQGDAAAADVYTSLGVYLGHTLAFYHGLYNFQNMLLLGRVMSGKGGNLIHETALRVLREEYPLVADAIRVSLPDEASRRIGQSVAAASLPKIER
ncbi:MAG TPA: ROK family protein, partial [Candidatus Limiplasma sp.]|nr:ROK family protein [Candidatus Limiplasma sp.]